MKRSETDHGEARMILGMRKRGRPTNADRINATAYPRNIRDGASTPAAIRTRLRLLATERGLAQSDIADAWSTHPDDLIQFAERHRVNLDWLICGKLAAPYSGNRR